MLDERDRENRARAEGLDSLTGLPDRQCLLETVAREVERAHDEGARLALIVLDVDNLKRINDEFGHVIADAALKGLANCIRHVVRPADAAGRIGGDEFVVVLPASTRQDARKLSTRLRRRIADQPTDPLRGMTFSSGIAELESGDESAELFNRADLDLRRGKERPPTGSSGVREPRRPKPSGGAAPERKPLPGS